MKALIIFLHLLLCTVHIAAQPSFYTETKTIAGDGYIYQCDVSAVGIVTLYKKGDKWIYADLVYRDTGKRIIMDNEAPDLIETVDNEFIRTCKTIINNAFTSEEKRRVEGTKFTLSMYINPDTGKVDEVSFEFYKIGTYATIPLSVYRKIEVGIKQKLRVKPTAEGKKLNYILFWIDVAPE